MEKKKLAIKYSVKKNMHTIAHLIGNRGMINHSPLNFHMIRLE